MKKIDIPKDNYNLHILKMPKFKTITVKVIFWNDIKKEELAKRNMLLSALLFSTKKYKSFREMSIKKEELYSASLYSKTYRRGTQILSEITLSVINDKYSEKGNLISALEFLFEVIMNPNVENGKFTEDAFDISYNKLKTSIISETEDPSSYAYKKFKRLIGDDKIFTSLLLGTLEDLNKVTRENLYDYYKEFLRENHIDVFVSGNINEKEMEEQIDKLFPVKANKKPISKIEITYQKDYSEEVEESNFNQSKLLMGGSIKELTTHEKFYEAILYNIILGNSPNSKLFANVREKNSFCYSISSSINRLDGLFYIYAGISSKNYEAAKKEIYNQLEEIKKGNFTENSLKDAKQLILSVLKEVNEYPRPALDHYFNYLYLGNDTIAVQKEEIKKITKEDIIKVASKINVDTVFFLKEGQNE